METKRTAQIKGYFKGLSVSSFSFLPLPKAGIQLFTSGSKILNSRLQSLDPGSAFLSHIWSVNGMKTDEHAPHPHMTSSGNFTSDPFSSILPPCPVSSTFSISLLSLQ